LNRTFTSIIYLQQKVNRIFKKILKFINLLKFLVYYFIIFKPIVIISVNVLY
jgi:hypothetical protein